MDILRLLLPMGICGFIGCAYFSDGATTRIKIRKQEGERIFLNKVALEDTIQQVEIRNSKENLITIKNDDSETSEVVRSEINPSVFGNFAWPNAFVDLKLGSHRQIADGNSYKVLAASPEIQNACEGKARDKLKVRNIDTSFNGCMGRIRRSRIQCLQNSGKSRRNRFMY